MIELEVIEALNYGCMLTVPESITPKDESVVYTVMVAIMSGETGFLAPLIVSVIDVPEDIPELPTIAENVKVYDEEANEHVV